jgi:dipeptidyl aminopeptidase/acylaminoacyl peptidase
MMQRSIVMGFSILLSLTLLFSQEKRSMTTDDVLDMVRVGNAQMSPGGDRVLYSKSELDWKKNKRKTTYYMASVATGESYQYLSSDIDARSPQFSPDGRYLGFLRKKDKKDQIYLLRTGGGEGVQLTKSKSGVRSFKWAPDSATVFFVAEEAKDKKEEKAYKDGYDAVFVDEGPHGQREGKWRYLWMIDVKDKEEKQLTTENLVIGDFDVAPNGSRILFSARKENRRNQGYLSEIYLLSLGDDKTVERLTQNEAPERGVQWAPDGSKFSFVAPDDKKWELRSGKIWLMDLTERKAQLISSQFEGDFRGYFWSQDSKSIYFSGLQRTDSNLFRLDVASGDVDQLTQVVGSLGVSSMSKDRSKMVFSRSDFQTPADLWVSATHNFNPVRLTDANPWVREKLDLASGQVIEWKSSDGLTIEGLLFLPPGHKDGDRLPLILNIHGGPAGVFRNDFSGKYHVFGGLGYASLCPNVRGSSGYGDDLLRGNMKDIGGGDFQDLMTGVDAVIERGWVDAERMGVRGWSYGGILGGWTITQTDRFKAASVGAMVSDWTSEYGPGFNHDVRLWYIGGTPWENPEGYREKSALTHVENVTTPTLIIHGMRDFTDTEPQSMMFFTALKDLGKEVRYLRFPREPHGFREPRHQRTRDIEEIRWMLKYIEGKDWEPWERPEPKKDEEDSEEDETETS